MKFFVFFSLLISTAFAQTLPFSSPQISIQNHLLAKVNGNMITVLDVVKKMDVSLHRNYPEYADSPQARIQFYSTNWQNVLQEMVNAELILCDADHKEVKVTDGDVREEMENRFGPNVTATLDKLGLTTIEAEKMLRKDLVVQRMMWFFVQSRAFHSVSPQDIREGYRQYLEKNPPLNEWVYRVISLRPNENNASDVDAFYQEITKKPLSSEEIETFIKEKESAFSNCKIQLSTEYVTKDQELSLSHREALASLHPGELSKPICQKSRLDGQDVTRIFYLKTKNENEAPSFDSLSLQIKNQLIQSAVASESDHYIKKLRDHFGLNAILSVPDDFQPFHLE